MSSAEQRNVPADRPAPKAAPATVHFGHGWLSRRCVDCGQRKPLFTAYCDRCAEQHGLTVA